MNSHGRVLLVDDEYRVLEGLRRTLQAEFETEIACGSEQGLEIMAEAGPFAVVVSDLRMPMMDGVQFLAKVKAMYPDTIRVMLTGQADLNAAINSVNDGAIFRFLTKPCPPMIFRRTISAAMEQHRLVMAERDLLRNTLMGAVTMLTEILSVLHPKAFGRSFRIKRYVMQMEQGSGGSNAWQLEIAGILSQIGCITLPSDICDKAFTGTELAQDEQGVFDLHPIAAAAFLKRIPRFESVAQMIAGQHKPYGDFDDELAGDEGRLISAGAQKLHVAVDLEKLRRNGLTWEVAIAFMRKRAADYNPVLLDALERGGDPFSSWTTVPRTVSQLELSMVADQDIVSRNGLVLAKKGEQLSLPLLERIHRLAGHDGVDEPILMRIPAQQPAPTSAVNLRSANQCRAPLAEQLRSSL
jgi:response regulator RpfG family c-di-GMP phosphodiesterase